MADGSTAETAGQIAGAMRTPDQESDIAWPYRDRAMSFSQEEWRLQHASTLRADASTAPLR